MANRKDDDLDFTGPYAAYKPPADVEPSPPSPEVERAAEEAARALVEDGFHVLIARMSKGERRARTVLLVEPDATVVAQVRHMLDLVGIAVLDAPDARSTSRLLSKSSPPGMFLLGIHLPGAMDGFGLLQHLRVHPKLSSIPVVLFTTPGSHAEIVRGITDGAAGYLVKHPPTKALVGIVRALLGD